MFERLLKTAINRPALHLQDLLQAPLDILERGGEVVLVEGGAALLAELLEEITQPLEPLAERIAHPPLQQVAQGVLQIPEVHQVIREGVQHVVWIERRDLLRAVPL